MAQMTPGSWLGQLEAMLEVQQAEIGLFIDYREGRHRLRYATAKFRQAFGGMFSEFADNWCELIVEAPVERLRVQGFRMGVDLAADKDAWGIWQSNNMDSTSSMVHREAVTCGQAFWLVEPPRNGSPFPRITAEHPSQVVVATSPGDHRTRQAALKKWVDVDGHAYATVYLPDVIYKWRSERPVRDASRVTWQRRGDDPGGRNPLGVVPVIPVVNAPNMLGGGRSDLRNAIPLQDAINKTMLDMLIASEFAAFPQRVAIGVEAPKNPDGTPVINADVKMSMSKLLTFSDPAAKIAQYSAADLSNYVNALAPLVQHLAGQTRTPPHYLLGQMVNVSGDALKAAESGLVARTSEKKRPFGEGHEEAMRLAFLSLNDTERGTATSAETIWADVEFRNFGELVDGLTKLRGLNIPDEILWERAGFSPTEITRIKELQAMDSILVEPRSSVPVTAPTATEGPGGQQQVASAMTPRAAPVVPAAPAGKV